jgi:hypothetical protein
MFGWCFEKWNAHFNGMGIPFFKTLRNFKKKVNFFGFFHVILHILVKSTTAYFIKHRDLLQFFFKILCDTWHWSISLCFGKVGGHGLYQNKVCTWGKLGSKFIQVA